MTEKTTPNSLRRALHRAMPRVPGIQRGPGHTPARWLSVGANGEQKPKLSWRRRFKRKTILRSLGKSCPRVSRPREPGDSHRRWRSAKAASA